MKLVGVVNLTPDSFSDGGLADDVEEACAHIDRLIAEGADVIDIGAESTRPGATPVSAETEWQKLEPVLKKMLAKYKKHAVRFSVDTRHAETAKQALRMGVNWINDVSGAQNPRMVQDVAAHDSAVYVLMHSLGVPADPAVVLTEEADVVEEILKFGHEKIAECEKLGLPKERIIFDPGIGFGKTPEQSLALIHGVKRFKALDVPLLYGHSRKSFLTQFTDAPPAARDEKTLAISLYLADREVDYLRVHNVGLHRQGFLMWEQMRV